MNDTNISTIQEDPGWSITTHHAGLPIEPKNSKLLTLLPPLNGLVHPRCLLESQAEANEQTTSSVKASHSKEASFEEGCQTTVTCSSTLQVSRTRMHDQPPHLWVQSILVEPSSATESARSTASRSHMLIDLKARAARRPPSPDSQHQQLESLIDHCTTALLARRSRLVVIDSTSH